MKPGVERACTGVLPQRLASSKIAAATAARSAGPETTSTSFISGTGLKKCMPTKRPGALQAVGERRDRDRRGVRGEHAVGADDRLELAEEAALDLGVLDDRLDRPGRAAPASSRRVAARMRAAIAFASAGSSLPLVARPSSVAASLAHAAARGAFAGVEQGDGVAGLRRDLGDAGAHDAGADDEDGRIAVEAHRTIMASARSPVASRDGADYSARQASGDERCAIWWWARVPSAAISAAACSRPART